MFIHHRAICIWSAVLATTHAASQVTIDWVNVGNAGNVADQATGFGAVEYAFRIGATEVTNEQYAAFLNAVASSDPNGLYNTNMGSNPRGGISRSGTNGTFVYAVKPNMGNKPVNYVSWYDAARMCNWLTNGQGSAVTESGVYTFDGVSSVVAITRNLADPTQAFLPTEDEWYKAAYHQPADLGRDADDYWLYATENNSTPAVAIAASNGDVANPGVGVVNYASSANWNGVSGNVTSVRSAGAASFYGAFDMNGNVSEWNETLVDLSRGFRGGGVNSSASGLESLARRDFPPTEERLSLGFRLASPVCLADVNDDGLADPADFNAWVLAFNSNAAACDQNGDGLCNPSDFNALILNFNAGC
ncbi:MAG: SUMF1/EgtB/PvdO family nonheme iron enzyme [Planctomycetota bacterium]